MAKQNQSLSAEALARICEVVDRFDVAWHAVAKGGSPPWIEEALRGRVPAERPVYLKNLLSVELECRTAFGEQPTVNEYQKRFPKDAELVADVFLEFEHSQAGETLDEDSVSEELEATKTPEWQTRPAPSPGAVEFQPGDLLHDYQLLEQLGQGGMGTVFKAKHSRLMKIVALKVLAPERLRDPGAVARFQREMEAVGQLRDRHVVEAFDAGEARGVHYLVMEYVEGLDAAAILRRRTGGSPSASATALSLGNSSEEPRPSGSVDSERHPACQGGSRASALPNSPNNLRSAEAREPLGQAQVAGNSIGPAGRGSAECSPLRVADACEIIRQAALGLHHAHQLGLIHRDIKPSNLMVSAEGTVKVLDLGLARLHAEHPAGNLTSTGNVMGTVDYIAPEQILDSHNVDLRADLYSLGCTFYSLLAGEPPFAGPSYSSAYLKMKAHENTAPPYIPRADIPGEVLAVLEKLLRKQPAERFASAADVAAVLAPFTVGSDLVRLVGFVYGGYSHDETAALRQQRTAAFTTEVQMRPQEKSPSRSFTRAKLPSSRPLMWWASAVTMLAVLAVVGSRFWKPQEPPSSSEPNLIAKFKDRDRAAAEWVLTHGGEIEIGTGKGEEQRRISAEEWQPGPSDNGLPGVVTRPATLPGIKRWQVTTVLPRSPIPSVSWSKQGLLAVGSLEGMVRVYDAQTMQLRQLLGPHGRQRNDNPDVRVAWSPQGDWLASVCRDGLRLWKSDGTPGPVFDIGYAQSAAWHPNGELLAVRSPFQVHFCRIDGTRGPVIGSHTDCLAWSPDGSRLAMGGAQGKDGIRFWKQDGSADGEISNVPGPTISLAWSPTGDRLVTGNRNGVVQIWKPDGTSGPVLAAATAGLGAIFDLQWSSDGQHIAAATDEKGGQVWRPDGSLVASIPTRDGVAGLFSIAWSSDAQRLAVSWPNHSSTFAIWDLKGHCQMSVDTSHANHVNRLASNADGQTLAVPDAMGRVRFWKPSGEQTSISAFVSDASLHQVQWHPQLADRLAWSDGTHAGFNLWSTLSKANLDRQISNTTQGLVWSPRGDQVLASAGDSLVSLWSESGAKVKDIALPGRAGRIAWSPKGDWLAGQIGGEVRLFQLDGSVTPLPHSSIQVTHALAFDSAGQWLAASVASAEFILAEQQGIRVWPIPTGEPKVLNGHDTPPHSLAWHPTEPWLYSASNDGRVMKWDVTTGTTRTFEMPNEEFIAVDCSRVGAVLTARGWNNSLYRLDPVTLAPVWSAVLLNDDAYATFSPAGELLHGDATQVEKQLIYILDTADGHRELLKPSEFQQRVAAALKPSPTMKPTTKDTERAAAEWLLSVGGRVRVCDVASGVLQEVTAIAGLPKEPFVIEYLFLSQQADLPRDELRRLAGLSGLQALNLIGCPTFNDDDLLALRPALRRLKGIALVETAVTDAGLSAIQDSSDLTDLVLFGPKISDVAMEHIVTLLKIQRLDLSFTQISDRGLAKLSSQLDLIRLTLTATRVTAAGIAELSKFRNLNHFGVGGIGVDVFEELGKLPKLESLDLDVTQVTSHSMDALSKAPKLWKIIFGAANHATISRSRIEPLARLPHLEELHLTAIALESTAWQQVAMLERLTRLHCDDVTLGDDDLQQLVPLKSLKSLHCIQTKLTPAGLAKFKAARPDVMIETDIK